MPARATRLVLAGLVLMSLALSGCGTSNVVAPLGRAKARDNVSASAQGVYRVQSGDSLYSVAWRYGLDYRELGQWNGIGEPYTIFPGQLLHVSRPAVLPPAPRAAAADAPVRERRTAPEPEKPAPRVRAVPSPPKPAPAAPEVARAEPATESVDVAQWRWPVKGTVIGAFGKAGGKGIDIAGERGAAIEATAPGHVVYSGSGLRGYGQLIILKHNKRYLSAYAHNDRLHVKEGDIVQGGQRIAEMGDSGAKSVRLHFEIRRDGQPVDPTQFLPR